MSTRPPAPSAPAAPSSSQVRSPKATIPSAVPLSITSDVVAGCDRILIYGTGGIGKSTLAAWLPSPLFMDVERSTRKMKVARDSALTWAELRGKLASIANSPPKGIRSLVLDSATVAEEMAKEYVIETRTTEKGKRVDSIEGFPWGKGWQFVYDEFNALLADLDRIADMGLNVCLIAHDVSTPAPNPSGEDFIRWEPHLYNGDKNGRGSIRARVKEWADHVLFIDYDKDVEDGKAIGSGTRTIHTQELPTHIAKSRVKQFTISFDLSDAGRAWRELNVIA